MKWINSDEKGLIVDEWNNRYYGRILQMFEMDTYDVNAQCLSVTILLIKKLLKTKSNAFKNDFFKMASGT